MYLIKFPFTKTVRVFLHPTIDLKNPLQILFWNFRLFKGVLKILENVQEKLLWSSFKQIAILQIIACSLT